MQTAIKARKPNRVTWSSYSTAATRYCSSHIDL